MQDPPAIVLKHLRQQDLAIVADLLTQQPASAEGNATTLEGYTGALQAPTSSVQPVELPAGLKVASSKRELCLGPALRSYSQQTCQLQWLAMKRLDFLTMTDSLTRTKMDTY